MLRPGCCAPAHENALRELSTRALKQLNNNNNAKAMNGSRNIIPFAQFRTIVCVCVFVLYWWRSLLYVYIGIYYAEDSCVLFAFKRHNTTHDDITTTARLAKYANGILVFHMYIATMLFKIIFLTARCLRVRCILCCIIFRVRYLSRSSAYNILWKNIYSH